MPYWEVDEAAIESARSFGQFTFSKQTSIKTEESNYVIFCKNGETKNVQAACAQEAIEQIGKKEVAAIKPHFPSYKSFFASNEIQ